ncbi:helix-turn-helix transcriptional regulator [Amycolatopsis sp. cmx-4-61]|uniref:helix-turn-helix transcriptional regulator n=1 Tax=Amycolatopsis sp. cmx-4-61 TaxID=2790937 RepID=UPI00397E3E35
MDTRSLEPNGGAAFVGRAPELRQLAHGAELVCQGRSNLALVHGEQGIGKTALVGRALSALSGFTVLHAICDPSEIDNSLGVVAQLVSHLDPAILAEFPLLSGPPTGTRPFLVGAQLVALVSKLQTVRPIAIVIDDAQWADHESMQVLGFLGRRLGVHRVLIVITSRDGAPVTDNLHLSGGDLDVFDLGLGGLSRADIATLARCMGIERMADAVAEQVDRSTSGHPLYTTMVLAELSRCQEVRPDRPLPVPASLAAAVRQSMKALEPASRRLVEALAVLDSRLPLAVVAEVAGVADSAGALEPLLENGLVWWSPQDPSTPVTIRHRLPRNAVYEAIAPRRRRELHRIASSWVAPSAAWAHRVAATEHTDETLAGELEAVARRSVAEGDAVQAAVYLLWASDLSERRADQERRLLTAVTHLIWTRRFDRAQEYEAAVEACAPGPQRSCLLAAFATVRADFPAADPHVADALAAINQSHSASPDVGLAVALLAVLEAWRGNGENAVAMADRALAAGCTAPCLPVVKGTLAFGCGLREGPRAALTAFDEITDLPAKPSDVLPGDAYLLGWRGGLRLIAGELTNSVSDLTTALNLSATDKAVFIDERVVGWLSWAYYLLGHWDRAAFHTEQDLSLPEQDGALWTRALNSGAAALVQAGRGNWAAAAKHADIAEAAACRFGTLQLVHPVIARAAIAQARGDHDGILAALSPLLQLVGDFGMTGWPLLWHAFWLPMHVEALIGTGRLPDADEALKLLMANSEDEPYLALGRAWFHGWLTEASGDPARARAIYEAALDAPPTNDDTPLYRARLQEAYGLLLMGQHQRRSGLSWLNSALQTYTTLGARPFAERCKARLTGLGATPQRRPETEEMLELTDREREIVLLIARGMTNSQIARELYVSVKTVEFHVTNTYAKLGINSRRELRDRYSAISADSVA